MPCMIEAVRDVLDGKTAAGEPSPLPRLRFPNGSYALLTLMGNARVMEEILDKEVSSDERLTALLRKLATYITRRGTVEQLTSLTTETTAAAYFLRNRPCLITSRMGLGRIIALATEPEVIEERKRQRCHDMLTKFQMPPYVPRASIWHSADRRFGLFELVHPKHVYDTGRRLNNCLSTHFIDEFMDLGFSASLDQSLPFLAYWQNIAKGRRRLFAFHEFHEPQVLMSFDGNRLSEIELHGQHEALLLALAEALTELSCRLEPPGLNLRSTVIPHKVTEGLVRRLRFAPGAMTAHIEYSARSDRA